MNKHLDLTAEVRQALEDGKPVVALESTIISHGMPYPKNVQTALAVEKTIRENGAVPATVAIIGGRLKAGLTADELEYFGKKGTAITKVSRRDIPGIVAKGQDGATTVAATMMIAAMAGIKVFATGGIGGVHRGAENTMDISADLDEFTKTPVMVVCAGAKAILDLNLTMEYLETKGIPVYCYRTDELPAFYTRNSGIRAPFRADSARELADIWKAKTELGIQGGFIVANPIPREYSMDPVRINGAIDEAISEMNALGIRGKETTPYLLDKVQKLTGGESLESNIRLVLNNAALAAQIACELAKA
ncbi:MAG: pseudouridine-5'-phosphate glycosidase [Spirochaetales bacterium]|nr:pseudouridine-5'-phosphate glycosidase [Spirochaetales bacterium]